MPSNITPEKIEMLRGQVRGEVLEPTSAGMMPRGLCGMA